MRLLPFAYSQLQQRLDHYLAADTNFRQIFDHTKQRFQQATHLTAHNWPHCYRDTINAIVIGEAEGADMSTVLPAATMHDIGFLYGAKPNEHGDVGADRLPGYLSEIAVQYSQSRVEQIAECIKTHKGGIHGKQPASLEAKVVADADLLEKFGAFGVYQTVRTYAEFNWPISKAIERGERILSVKLETETGRKLAEPGRQLTADFYKSLALASEPYGGME